jgi:predicted Zn finger-like uncharacterized protein
MSLWTQALEINMNGTTLCPHCDTRFKIAEAQLAAHQGMVRCGHCLQAFDARISFIADEPDPQLELPMHEQEALPCPVPEIAPDNTAVTIDTDNDNTEPLSEPSVTTDSSHTDGTTSDEVAAPTATLDFMDIVAEAQQSAQQDVVSVDQTPTATLAEQVVIAQDDEPFAEPPKPRVWPWAVGSAVLTLGLLLQASYLFRVELAARLPGLKPALVAACKGFDCTVPLPRNAELIDIVSSELEADPAHENLITLNALLRNRATYAQAYPELELTLNDNNDKPLARRLFHPKDYLGIQEHVETGIVANRELEVKIPLDVTTLKPTGYRLMLLYP